MTVGTKRLVEELLFFVSLFSAKAGGGRESDFHADLALD